MKKSYFILLLIIFSQTVFSQGMERKVLRGRIVADSIEVEKLTVFNISSKIGAITDIDGQFSINARATDTLYIQGLSYDSKKYVLSDKDFWLPVLEIKLHIKVTELNEVIVTPFTLTGDLNVDTKRIQVYGDGFSKIDAKVVKNYEDDINRVLREILRCLIILRKQELILILLVRELQVCLVLKAIQKPTQNAFMPKEELEIFSQNLFQNIFMNDFRIIFSSKH